MKHHYNLTEPDDYRVAGRLPKDQRVLQTWLENKVKLVVEHQTLGPKDLHPIIQEFQTVIEGDAGIFMAFHQMFEQIPNGPPYDRDPTGKPQVRDYMTMLRLFDIIIREAPTFEDSYFVAFPINAILDWPMGTPAGYAAFVNPKVNAMFHKMFNVWSEYLSSPASRSVLDDSLTGWFGPAALQKMPDLVETFICDPSRPFHGFQSWDDFFTRRFRPGVRPIEFPDNDFVINCACESTVYKIAHNVKARDEFWIKQEPYSLVHMLNNDPVYETFVGGSIWQGFLNALNYHRWASPVNGTVTKTVNIPGTYYAESPATSFVLNNDDSPAGPKMTQSFITSVATRALIFIQADNPCIGLMCFLAVGMAEVSTCEVTVNPGDVVRKGDELGMFHFGGSTHCLIFRPEAKVQFSRNYPEQADVKLGVAIATVQE